VYAANSSVGKVTTNRTSDAEWVISKPHASAINNSNSGVVINYAMDASCRTISHESYRTYPLIVELYDVKAAVSCLIDIVKGSSQDAVSTYQCR
jgi:hypothetical protein